MEPSSLWEHDVRRSGTLLGVADVLLDVAEFRLRTPEYLFGLALDLQRLVADQLAGEFFDLAFRFLDSAFDLILVRGHGLLREFVPEIGRHTVRSICGR